MACFYQAYRDMLVLRCDACRRVDDVARGQTDRLLANDYIRAHGWKTTKIGGRWTHLCPDCNEAVREQKREAFLKRLEEEEDGKED